MIERMVTGLARVSPTPLLVRVSVFAAGLAALLVAISPERWLALGLLGLLGLMAAAAVPAVAPGRWAPTGLVLAAAAAWVLLDGQPPTGTGVGRVIALASLLYLLHTLAALAATLPYDAVVAPEAVLRWLGRTLAVLTGTAVLIMAVLVGLPRLLAVTGLGGQTHGVAILLGLGFALAALLVPLAALPRR